MARYQCSVCGYIFDEEKEGRSFSELTECPVCKQPVSKFVKLEDEPETAGNNSISVGELSYDESTIRSDKNIRYMDEYLWTNFQVDGKLLCTMSVC